jgi:hypothetical protein
MLFARLQHQYRRDGGIRNFQTYPTIPSLPIFTEIFKKLLYFTIPFTGRTQHQLREFQELNLIKQDRQCSVM